MRLKVSEAYNDDVYKDTARVHKSHRNGLRSGRLAKVSVVGATGTIVAVRGLDEGKRNQILLDLETRRRLGVGLGETHDFSIARIWPWEGLLWAWNASDPAIRVSTWIAIWTFALGIIIGAAISALFG